MTDAVGGITGGEAGEGFGQPLVGVDGAELATFDERSDHRPVVAALVGTGKQGIFAIASQRPDRSFDGIGVEVDATVIDEALEAVPAGECVADRFAEFALGAALAATGGKILVNK